MKRIFVLTLPIICVILSLQLLSCGGAADSENPEEKLKSYCVRQCVLETGDSSICDTRCKCAAVTLSDKLSAEELNSLLSSITGKDTQASDNAMKEFEKAFSHCKSVRF